jgi:hypothetical protein
MKLPESITSVLDKTYDLVYVDYDSNFDFCPDKLQQAIREQDSQCLYEEVDDWMGEACADSVSYILDNNLPEELSRAFDVDVERAALFVEKYEDELKDEIYERDCSDPVADMLRHTEDPVMFFDTGYEVQPEAGMDGGVLKDEVRGVKKALKIPARNTRYDSAITLMIEQASYGGQLVIYFRADVKDMLQIKNPPTDKPKNTVMFTNPMIAIIDTVNGSGDNTDVEGWTVKYPLDLDSIFLDKTIKYSYTYRVCGMYSNWCDCTAVAFMRSRLGMKREKKSSAINALQAREAEYNRVFKTGGCTFGDIDINRHRNTYYLNDYPCGTHCPKCGMFWVD